MSVEFDFVRVRIERGDWADLDADIPATRSRLHWLPKSRRALAWFEMASYFDKDLKRQRFVINTFGGDCIYLSLAYVGNDLFPVVGSRVKDGEALVEMLDNMEKAFMIGFEKGFFKGIMYDSPAPKDFWEFVLSASAIEDRRTKKRFLLPFARAFHLTTKEMLEAVEH